MLPHLVGEILVGEGIPAVGEIPAEGDILAVEGILGMRMHWAVDRHPWMNKQLVVDGQAWNCSFGKKSMDFEGADNFPWMNMLP